MRRWSRTTKQILGEHHEGLSCFDGMHGAVGYNVENPGLVELRIAVCGEASRSDRPAYAYAYAYMPECYEAIIPDVARHLTETATAGEIDPNGEASARR